MNTWSPDTAIDKGRFVLREFHNASLKFAAYKLNYEELVSKVGGKSPSIVLEGIGDSAIQLAQDGFLTDTKITKAMQELASRAQGRVPESFGAFFSALSGKATNVTFVQAVPYVAIESAKDVAVGFQQVGESAIDTLKTVNMLAPLAIVLALGFIFYSKTRQIAGL
jgi:hypothetical protein